MPREDDAAWQSYFEPGTQVLRNTREIRDPWTLSAFERRVSGAAFDALSGRQPPQRFDLSFLQMCHGELFNKVYPWAGQPRYVNMQNPVDPAGPFQDHWRIASHMQGLSQQLQREGELRSLSDGRQWADRAGYYWAQVNNCHPFREGNGRSTRLFMQQLAKAAGHDLDWGRVKRELGDEAINEASRAGRMGRYEGMREVLQYAATGSRDRSASPRGHLDFLDNQLGQELGSHIAIQTSRAHPREPMYQAQAQQAATRVLAILPGQYPPRQNAPQGPGPAARPGSAQRSPTAPRLGHDRTNRDVREARQPYQGRGYGR